MQTRMSWMVAGVAALVVAGLAFFSIRSPDTSVVSEGVVEPASEVALGARPAHGRPPPDREPPPPPAPEAERVFVPGSGPEALAVGSPSDFEPASPESERAAESAQRIHDNVLRLFDAAFSPDFSAQVDVECSADGSTCRFEGPLDPSLSFELLNATADGRWDRGELEGIRFEDMRRTVKDGKNRFTFVAHAPWGAPD